MSVIAVDAAGVPVDSPLHTVDGLFLGVVDVPDPHPDLFALDRSAFLHLDSRTDLFAVDRAAFLHIDTGAVVHLDRAALLELGNDP